MTAPEQVASTAQGEAAAMAGTAKDEAGNVASTAKGEASNVAGTTKQEASNVLGETVEQAKNLTGQAKEQATQQVSAQSEKLTGTLRDLSKQMSEGDTSGLVGQALSEAGQRVQGLADHLEQVGPEGLLSEVRDYARRSPGTFLLGMAVAGFATGRIVKGLGAGKKEQPALPPGPSATGTAAGDPLAGVAEPGLGTSAGYTASPYPDATYAPVDPAPATSYGAGAGSPLPSSTQSRGAL